MTRTTYARIAGFMFLFYMATALPSVLLFDQAASGTGIAAKLASIAEHAPHMHLIALLSLLIIVDALVLAVALYAITRDEEPDLAILALSCRVGEGLIVGAVPALAALGLLLVATDAAAGAAPDGVTANALGALLLKVRGWSWIVGSTLFAIGSTLYSYLFLRARSIPVWLAWLGIVASVVLVVGLPLQFVELIGGVVGGILWIPMILFEVPLGFWLLIKGVKVQEPEALHAS